MDYLKKQMITEAKRISGGKIDKLLSDGTWEEHFNEENDGPCLWYKSKGKVKFMSANDFHKSINDLNQE